MYGTLPVCFTVETEIIKQPIGDGGRKHFYKFTDPGQWGKNKKNMNYTAIYPEKRTFEKYDGSHYALYLNEQVAEYTPMANMEREAEQVAPISGFSYTGSQEDGSTLIKAEQATYADFVSGLIRLRYSNDAVEAINSNMILALQSPKNVRASEFIAEHEEYQTYRAECKVMVSALFEVIQ